MARLDPATLLVGNALTFALIALLMGFCLATQPTYPGFREWFAGVAAVAAGLLALTVRTGRAAVAAIALANLLLVAGVEYFHRGSARFSGEDVRLSARDVAVYGMGVVLFGWWLTVDYDVQRRIVVFCLCLAWGGAKAAAVCFRNARGPFRALGTLLACANAGIAVFSVARALVALGRATRLPQDLLQRAGVEAALVAGTAASGVVAAFTFVVLHGRRATVELQEASRRVRQLEGIIPICMYCKKVRVDRDSWDRIEKYVSAHTQAKFSHGICPECFAREHGAL